MKACDICSSTDQVVTVAELSSPTRNFCKEHYAQFKRKKAYGEVVEDLQIVGFSLIPEEQLVYKNCKLQRAETVNTNVPYPREVLNRELERAVKNFETTCHIGHTYVTSNPPGPCWCGEPASLAEA